MAAMPATCTAAIPTTAQQPCLRGCKLRRAVSCRLTVAVCRVVEVDAAAAGKGRKQKALKGSKHLYSGGAGGE